MTTPRTINTQEPGKYHAQKTVGGWVVIFVKEDRSIRNVDGGKLHKNRQNAYAKAKRLNNEPRTVVLSEQAPQGNPSANARWGSSQDGTEMVTWLKEGQWYGCLQGIYQGNWFEGEDQGPFDTREEAEAYLREDYAESQRPQPDIYPSEDE